jgi:two-component system nitrogen regulation response regulator GlnG
MGYEVLLADDDDSIRLVLSKALAREGHTVKATDNASTLLKWMEQGRGDIVLTDVLMGGREVFDTLPDMTRARPEMPVIIISANKTVTTALKSGSHKVFEYVPKPFDLDDITNAVTRAGQGLTQRRPHSAKVPSVPMVGRSAAMQPVYRAISRYADTALPVLITGSVGTGKDLIARLLHEGGRRAARPFLRTHDFTNLSLTLQKVNGGDIFIDEIAGLNATQQGDLLGLMTESEQIPEDRRPRVISATRKNLRKLAESGAFRDDLYFRLNVAEVRVPDLSVREGDVGALAEHFLRLTPGGDRRRFETEALDVLSRHDWQGNVRELENLTRRLSVLYSDDVISAVMVLDELDKDVVQRDDETDDTLSAILKVACRRLVKEGGEDGKTPHQVATAWVEKPLIEEALRATGGNRARASDMLGIHRNTLRTRIAGLEID